MNKSFSRKRRIVEIYFILYLAALILLIPDKDDKSDKIEKSIGENIYQLDFSLKPLKTTLNCRLYIENDKVKIISIDSLNKVFYTGKVDNVEFEFSIEDKSRNSQINLTGLNTDTKYFAFSANPKEQSADFKWFPPIQNKTNKTYIVEVKATAISLESGKSVTDKTQFSLNVIFLNEYLTENTNELNDTLTQGNETIDNNSVINYSPNIYSDFSIVARSGNIETTALSRWERFIDAYSINLQQDLQRNPIIEIEGVKDGIAGTIDYDIIDRNTLRIRGIAPEYGSSKIKITLTRAYDNRAVTEEFYVSTLMLGEPEIPKLMYPEIRYIIKPNLPNSTSANTIAIIKNSQNDTIAISHRGGDIKFQASHKDTSSGLFLERYINNKMIGQRNPIVISSLPPPQIISPSETEDNSGKKVVIYTMSKGSIYGRENFVTELILNGNAKYRELTGSETIDRQNLNIKQKFELVPIDPDKPFVFSVKAKNEEGKISREIRWPQI